MLAGHNRGKKWVPGVGYRTPDRGPIPYPPMCQRRGCRARATAWASWHGWRCEAHRTKHPRYRANAGAVPRRGSDVGTSPLLAVSGSEDK